MAVTNARALTVLIVSLAASISPAICETGMGVYAVEAEWSLRIDPLTTPQFRLTIENHDTTSFVLTRMVLGNETIWRGRALIEGRTATTLDVDDIPTAVESGPASVLFKAYVENSTRSPAYYCSVALGDRGTVGLYGDGWLNGLGLLTLPFLTEAPNSLGRGKYSNYTVTTRVGGEESHGWISYSILSLNLANSTIDIEYKELRPPNPEAGVNRTENLYSGDFYFTPTEIEATRVEPRRWCSGFSSFQLYTYLGEEDLSLPSGTYRTIRMNSTTSEDLASNWIDARTGLILRCDLTVSGYGTYMILLDSTNIAVPKPSKTLTILLQSPADIYVTDYKGAHVGYDSSLKEVVNEVDGATYTLPGSKPQRIEIPNPFLSDYYIALTPTASGAADLSAQLDSQPPTTQQVQLSQGQILSSLLHVSARDVVLEAPGPGPLLPNFPLPDSLGLSSVLVIILLSYLARARHLFAKSCYCR